MLRGHGDCFYLNRMSPLLVVGVVEEPSLLLPSQQCYYGRDLMRTQDPLCQLSECHIAVDKLIPGLLILIFFIPHFGNVEDFTRSILYFRPEGVFHVIRWVG